MPIAAAIPTAITDLIEAMGITMKAKLKIKIMSLGAEAALIHKAETRIKLRLKKAKAKRKAANLCISAPWMERWREIRASYRAHRKWDIRPETRAALLAYGYLRGKRYRQIENKAHTAPNLYRIVEIAKKFGKSSKELQIKEAAIKAWLSEEPAIELAVQPVG